MTLTAKKYREDTKKWACYKVEPNPAGIEGQIFLPVSSPEAQNELIELEVK